LTMTGYNNPNGKEYGSESPLPPRVEVTVERLDGIIWSTPTRPTSKDELKKRVPFVTAAVEFAGTCPNMKVYSASKYPHCKYPAVESFFASLASEEAAEKISHSHGSEVTKITSTTIQDTGGKTTTTTTTTITTIHATTAPRYKDGHYPLVAKWYDDSNEEKLVDSVTFFTSPKTLEEAESKAGTLPTQGRSNNGPHLTLTLPTATDRRKTSFLTTLFAPCQHPRSAAQVHRKKDNNSSDSLLPQKTHSTAASTLCSGSQNKVNITSSSSTPDFTKLYKQNSSQLTDLGSLLETSVGPNVIDSGLELQASSPISNYVIRKEEADVAPVVATNKSKEVAATLIAAEPSSAVVGQMDKSKSSPSTFDPLSWINCGSVAPEIVELRVRVMPEDSDDFDEMDPAKQHLVARRELEGVAHLIFLDQIVEEGTTVMDLPLRVPQESNAMTRTLSTLGGQEYVKLGANAMLRVRVTVIPEAKVVQSQQPRLDADVSMKTEEAQPESDFAFLFRPLAISFSAFDRLYEVVKGYREARNAGMPTELESAQNKAPTGPFPHQFPSLVTDCSRGKKVESFLGVRKTTEDSRWGWFKVIPRPKHATKVAGHNSTQIPGGSTRRRDPNRQDTRKFFTIARSSSSLITEESTSDQDEAS
jgi:hypothetical protein